MSCDTRDIVVAEAIQPTIIVNDSCSVVVVAPATQGPAGIPGPAAGAAFQRVAGETVSALQVLYELDGQVFVLTALDADHIFLLLGVAMTAATAGNPVNVQRNGAIDDLGWSWTPGPVWLGSTGNLTQTTPVTGFDVLIGAAVSPTRIILDPQQPIVL